MDIGEVDKPMLNAGIEYALAFCMYESQGLWGKYRFNEILPTLSDSQHDFFLLSVTEAEIELIWKTCTICTRGCTELRYKFWDRMLRATPFVDLTDRPLLELTSASQTQIALLALRESIDPTNVLYKPLLRLNGVTATPGELRNVVMEKASRLTLKDAVGMLV